MERRFWEPEVTKTSKLVDLVREGRYIAEVEVTLIETESEWSPYFSLGDAEKLDKVRFAARLGRFDCAQARWNGCQAQALQSVPYAWLGGTRARGRHSELCQRVAVLAVVAERTGYDDVVESARAAVAVGNHMVELKPHALERGVLLVWVSAPWHYVRVEAMRQFADFRVDDGDATVTATVSVTFERGLLHRIRRIALGIAARHWDNTRVIGRMPMAYIEIWPTPGRVGPRPNCRRIRLAQQCLGTAGIAS